MRVGSPGGVERRCRPGGEQRREQCGGLQSHADAFADQGMGFAGSVANPKGGAARRQTHAGAQRTHGQPRALTLGAVQQLTNATALAAEIGLHGCAGSCLRLCGPTGR